MGEAATRTTLRGEMDNTDGRIFTKEGQEW